MRQFVRHLVFVPGNKSAGSNGDNVLMVGHVGVTVFAHETGHSLDSHAFDPSYGVPFSTGNVWVSNYSLDSAVPDPYAQSSQQENFARQTVVSLYDKVVPGGIGTMQPNCRAIFRHPRGIQWQRHHFPAVLAPTVLRIALPRQCPALQKSRRALGPKPKVKEIEAIPMESSITMTSFDEHGKPNGTYVVYL
ncbi:hypothetical protein V8C34DRAFT_284053 [Trichoderma compactum]